MTSWNPVWRVKIAGTTYTSYVVNSLTVSSGRTDIYSQPNAGYCNVELLNYDNIPYSWSIGSTITVEVQNSSGTYVSLFGGYVTDITTSVGSAGSIKNITRINVIAAGALSKLPKQITTGILSQDYDGNQIYSLLAEYLLNSWNEVATTQQWSTYTATTTWANAENIGLGEVDRPGTYTMENRASNNIDIYSLAAQIAASGLGYLYEDSSGNTCYASATHRQDYLAANGYTTLDANTANFQGIRSTIRSGDVRNKMIINYGNNFGLSVTSQDSTSQLTYGVQGESINSYVHSATDAQSIADRYISLRKEPNARFDAITFAVQNPEISDATRNKLLTIFMGMPIRITNLPLNISDTQFEGYVEGWTFRSSVNGLTVTISASPIVYSQIALNWTQVSGTKAWNGLSGTLTWEKAIGAVA